MALTTTSSFPVVQKRQRAYVYPHTPSTSTFAQAGHSFALRPCAQLRSLYVRHVRRRYALHSNRRFHAFFAGSLTKKEPLPPKKSEVGGLCATHSFPLAKQPGHFPAASYREHRSIARSSQACSLATTHPDRPNPTHYILYYICTGCKYQGCPYD